MADPGTSWPYGDPERAAAGGLLVRPGPELCSAGRLFGGWALGLAATAARETGDADLRDLTVGFLRPIPVGARFVVEGERLPGGRSLSHVRLQGASDGVPALAGLAVTGPATGSRSLRRVPLAPPPDDCPERDYTEGRGAELAGLLDIRVAGQALEGERRPRVLLWGRLRCDLADDVRLAVLSDHLPYIVKRAVPDSVAVATVSATLRLSGAAPGEWVLLDMELVTSAGRTAVARLDLWSEDCLVGVSEQTVRLFGAGDQRVGPGVGGLGRQV